MPTLAYSPDAPLVLLSPHFDDAVLSCFGLLAREDLDTVVVNVFGGIPKRGILADWDRATMSRSAWRRLATRVPRRPPFTPRHRDSADQVARRMAEDQRALAGLGRTAVNLKLLDTQYRAHPAYGLPDPAPADLVAELARQVPSASAIALPAGLGGGPTHGSAGAHVDHLIVRSTWRELVDFGGSVLLYADLPYAAHRGWPDWVEPHSGSPDATVAWARSLRCAGLEPNSLDPAVRVLSTTDVARKRTALRAYGTQWHALRRRQNELKFEVVWQVSSPRPVSLLR